MPLGLPFNVNRRLCDKTILFFDGLVDVDYCAKNLSALLFRPRIHNISYILC